MDADMSFLKIGKTSLDRILLSLDIRGGVAKEMELVLEDKHFSKSWITKEILSIDEVVTNMGIIPVNVTCLFVMRVVESTTQRKSAAPLIEVESMSPIGKQGKAGRGYGIPLEMEIQEGQNVQEIQHPSIVGRGPIFVDSLLAQATQEPHVMLEGFTS
jgi:hypothetical protein